MKKTHGNCAEWTDESASQVLCSCGSMIPCWYSKNGNARKCTLWKPRNEEVRLGCCEIVAEFYEGETKPIVVIARCSDGKRYVVSEGHLTNARIRQWAESRSHYEEGGLGYYRATLMGAVPAEIVVVKGSEIGGR